MEQLVNFIIRPARADYNPIDDLLDQDFMLKGQCFQRKDLEVTNSRGVVLQCSHYLPLVIPEGTALPCVIYCHGNWTDASEAAIILLPSYITVFTLDFSGSGLSGGEHVTLGWNEKDDLKAVVNYLHSDENVSCIGLWGRSMGAVASLMYGVEDPSIAGIVLDSPFSDLVDLMNELVDAYKYPLPRFAVKFAIQYMRKVIQKKAKFDIMDLNTIKVAKSCFVPVLIGHAIDDDFIKPHHSERIYDAYVGDKNIIKFEGDHNSPRPQCYFDSITIFFHNVLNPPKDVVEGNYFDTMHDCSGKGDSDTVNEVGNTNHSFMEASKGLVTRNTEDATNELCPKRPMSRIEVPSDIPSKEMQSGNEEAHEHNPVSSSSGLTCFEFFNGHPFCQLVPSTIDDNQIVEYPLDTLSNASCNMEEEERMFMEAVIESLKDLENRHPHEEKEQLSNNGTNSPESSQMDNPASSNAENCGLSKMDDSSTSGANNTNDLASEFPPPGMSISFEGPTFGSTPPFMESRSNRTSTRSDGSMCNMNLSNGDKLTQDADILDGTCATLTVQKNPTRHIMDGLMHRWGLKFFSKKSIKMKKEM